MSIFNITKQSRIVILIMAILVLAGLGIAKNYYGNINKSEDPRIVDAKKMYGRYNQLAMEGSAEEVLQLLDSIETIYAQYDYYRHSFETGVLYNNRAAIYLTEGLQCKHDSILKKSMFKLAKENAIRSIEIYQGWMDAEGCLSEQELQKCVSSAFSQESLKANEKQHGMIVKKRIKDVLTAQYETKRRLSVAYTNLGIIQRHTNEPEKAIECYTKAIDLWDRNHSAKNNLNMILGRPAVKQSMLQRIFPPKKEEKRG